MSLVLGIKRALNCIDSAELQGGHDSHQDVKLPAQRSLFYYFEDAQGFSARHCNLLLHNVINFCLMVSFPPELPNGCWGERGEGIMLPEQLIMSEYVKSFSLPRRWCRWWWWFC